MNELPKKCETVHISEIEWGDTVLINNEMFTVGKNDLRESPFYGVSIGGEYFRESNKMVTRVLFPNWYKGEIISWVTQK